MIRVVETGRNPTMRYLQRTHGVSVAWLHGTLTKDCLDLKCELFSRMCADIYTKAFTDATLWVQVCDLINIVDPQRLAGLMQHVAEVVAGLDVVDIPTKSSGQGTGTSDSTGPPKCTKAPPPRGGVRQNIGASDSIGSTKGTKRATPALRRDAKQKLTENDRVATVAELKSIPH
eukprot:4221437-Heterocapsa_arctica.AAC.1